METYFSPSTRTFYIKGINHSIPLDAMIVSHEEHEKIFDTLNGGEDFLFKNNLIINNEKYYKNSITLKEVRKIRNSLLKSSDYIMLPDIPINTIERNKWKKYRQALRDIPDTYKNNPGEVVWPTLPEYIKNDTIK